MLGWLALGMVGVALLTLLCVTLQEDSEQREAKKVRQMSQRVAPSPDAPVHPVSVRATAARH